MKRIICIIVTWNKKDLLLATLERLSRRVVVPDGYSLDIAIIDNDSTDGTREETAERFPHVHIVNTGANLGGAGGFTMGMKYAMDQGYDYMWAMDNDATPSRKMLVKYMAVMETSEDRAMLGGTMNMLESPFTVNETGANLDAYGGIVLRNHRQNILSVLRKQSGPAEVDYVAFANTLFPVNLIREIGVFADFFIHYDDVDFCRRAKAAGYKVINVPDAVFWHESYQAKPAILLRYYDVRNHLYFLEQWNPKLVRSFRLRKLVDAAANCFRERYLLAEMTLQGVEDFEKGRTGFRATDRGGFRALQLEETSPDKLREEYGVQSFVMHYGAYANLLPVYRSRWNAFIRACGADFFFMDRVREGSFKFITVEPALLTDESPLDFSEGKQVSGLSRIARDALLLTDDETLNLRENLFLSRFKKRTWVWGAHIMDFGAQGWSYKLRFAGALLKRAFALVRPTSELSEEARGLDARLSPGGVAS